MTRLSMSMEEKSWMILRGGRVEKRIEKSTCSSRESKGRVNVTVSIPPPLAWNTDTTELCNYNSVHTYNYYGSAFLRTDRKDILTEKALTCTLRP